MIATWALVSALAALAQTVRFILQKRLTQTGLSASAATFARFVFAAPVLWVAVPLYAGDRGISLPGAAFWSYASVGGLAQIGGTIATVSLFSQRNFAVGVTFAKTEVLMAALVGLLVLGDRESSGAMGAILLGLAGVYLLSRNPLGGPVWNRATGLGLGAGLCFAVSGVCYRGASLALAQPDAVLSGATTLMFVTSFQAVIMAAVFQLRGSGEVGQILRAWRATARIGVFSLLGSLGWFIAFTLQTAALVKAVGQVELVFSLLASWLLFRETLRARELAGIALVLGSVLWLIQGGSPA